MKKNFDIEKAEAWAEEGFSGIEKNIEYNRVQHKAGSAGKKTVYKEHEGVFGSPLLQIAGVFIVAAIVSGLTFGVLKYLERIADQHQPAGTGVVTAPFATQMTEADTEPSTKPASVTGDTDTEPPETIEYEDGVTSVPLFKKLPGFVEDEEYCVYVLSDNGGIVGFQIERKGYDTSKITKETVNKHNSEKLFEYTGILYLAEYTQCIKEIPDFVLLGVYNMDSTAYTNPMLIGSKGPGGRIVVYYMYILEEFA
ncbi:MAG: hypothetical protein II135_06580, partial [Clostridia bacterium]|nr:hypothetical protein [Clostridia bacterium]